MQIISYPVHYQSVCTNFDFSLFSRISCTAKWCILQDKMTHLALQNGTFQNLVYNELTANELCFASPLAPLHSPSPPLGRSRVWVILNRIDESYDSISIGFLQFIELFSGKVGITLLAICMPHDSLYYVMSATIV